MNGVMQFLETTFGPLVFVFTVSNLAAMGLQVQLPQVIAALKNKKSLALIFVWGWVVGVGTERGLEWSAAAASLTASSSWRCLATATAPISLHRDIENNDVTVADRHVLGRYRKGKCRVGVGG